ncbi:tyrosine-protein kinase Fer-like [Saccoglossus kowalevskii]
MMAFGKELQSKASHDALLKLCDQEIRLLETMKKCITLRIKCDRDYTTSLAGFSTLGSRLDGMSIYDGQVYQAWSTVLKETDNICQKMKKSVEDLNENVLNKLNNLIREKIEMKRRYVQERIQVDTDYLKSYTATEKIPSN